MSREQLTPEEAAARSSGAYRSLFMMALGGVGMIVCLGFQQTADHPGWFLGGMTWFSFMALFAGDAGKCPRCDAPLTGGTKHNRKGGLAASKCWQCGVRF